MDDMFKNRERESEIYFSSSQGFIVRLDGKNFSRFTKGFKKPFDTLMTSSLIETASKLLEEFNPKTVFCCSDEISLIFPPVCTKEESEEDSKRYVHIFSGRTQKISSILASRCSVIFNSVLANRMKTCQESYSKEFIELVNRKEQIFDGRTFEYKTKEEALEYLKWRSLGDCKRNCVSQYAQFFFGKKKTVNMKNPEMVELIKTKIDWNLVPNSLKFGTILKKELVDKETTDNNGNIVQFQRGVIVAKDCDPKEFNEYVHAIETKYW